MTSVGKLIGRRWLVSRLGLVGLGLLGIGEGDPDWTRGVSEPSDLKYILRLKSILVFD